MAKQLNVNLAFTADTSQAKKQIQDLQTEFTKLIQSTSAKSSQMPFTREIQTALDQTLQLQAALKVAINTDTGKLNLSKFSESLKAGNISLTEYAKNLSALGSEGEKAFTALAKSIVTAETPVKQTNKLVGELWTTLKNTAKWQISSSAMHTLQSGISQAFGYAKDLNESLTNIRIVTGESSEQMAKFAEQANKAAKALSTTTTAYTDAALIFYQQGLSDDAVQKRTETTIKMAQATGDSVTQVSSYMTAVWNNFAEGSDNLEYFADVITALGAATASSSSEIAEGLEKFASIGETVGLSYEYATAALATITATTRASADVVGTSLKTIFSRLQGLNLGETLDDGTDLNKYSKALSAVGVNIKNADDSLKDMDQILDETAAKWQTLSRAQQMALAQTVAGVRQYTQFMTLMNNWDFMEENLSTAYGASGALEEQAQIYAESWEAAQKRVKAAAQAIYSDLIDEKFFIKIDNLLVHILNGVDNFIDGIGGISGVISGLGVLFTTVFRKQINAGIETAIYNISVFSGEAKKMADETRTEMIKATGTYFNSGGEDNASTLKGQYLKQEIESRYKLQQITELLTPQEKEYYEALLNTTEAYNKAAIAARELADASSEEQANTLNNILDRVGSQAVKGKIKDVNGNAVGYTTARNDARDFLTDKVKNAVMNRFSSSNRGRIAMSVIPALEKEYDSLSDKIIDYNEKLRDSSITEKESKQIKEKLIEAEKQQDDVSKRLAQNREYLTEVNKGNYEAVVQGVKLEALSGENVEKLIQNYGEEAEQLGITTEALRKYIDLLQQGKIKEANALIASEARNNVYDNENKKLTNFYKSAKSFANGLTTSLQALSQFSMGLSSIKGVIDALNNTDLTFFEKFTQALTGLGIGIPMLISSFGGVVKGLSGVGAAISKLVPILSSSTGALSILATEGIGAVTAGSISLGAALGALASVFVVVAAAIAAVVLAYKGLKLLWENFTFSGKLSKAKEELEELKNEAEETANYLSQVREEANNIKVEFNDYDSIIEKLQSCVKGSQEWSDALTEAKNSAQELIAKYNLIEGQDYSWSKDGTYQEFTEAGRQKIEKQSQEKVNNAIIDNYTAQAKQNESTQKIAKLEYEKSISSLQKISTDIETIYKNFSAINYGGSNFTKNISKEQLQDYYNKNKGNINQNSFGVWAEQNGINYSGFNQNLFTLLQNLNRYTEYQDKIDAAAEEYNNASIKIDEKNNQLRQAQILTANSQRSSYNSQNERAYSALLTGDKLKVSDENIYSNLSGVELAKLYYGEDKVIQGDNKDEYKFIQEDGTYSESKKLSEEESNQLRDRLVARDAAKEAARQGEQIDAEIESYREKIKGYFDSDTINNLANQQVIRNNQEIPQAFDLTGLDVFELTDKLNQLPKDLKESISDRIKVMSSEDWTSQATQSTQNASNITSLEQSLSKNDLNELTEDELSLINQLKEKYSELNEIRDTGSHEYLTVLRQIQEKEESNAVEALKNARSKAVEEQDKYYEEVKSLEKKFKEAQRKGEDTTSIEIELSANIDKFEKTIQTIQDTDYQIKIAVDADLSSDVDQAFGIANEFEKLKSYIPDSLEISFDRAQEIISAGYGEMLTNAEETANSTIKLNKEVLNAYIDNKQAEIQKDAESKIEQLENEKTLLVAKKEALTNKVAALNSALSASTEAEFTAAMANAETYQGEVKANQDKLQAQLTSEGDAATKKEEINETLFNTLGGMYDTDSLNEQNAEHTATAYQAEQISTRIKNVHELHAAYSALAQQIKASESGEVISPAGGSTSTGSAPTGSNSDKVETSGGYDKTIEKSESIDFSKYFNQDGTKETLQAIVNQAEAEIESTEHQIGAIDAGIAALKSAGKSLDEAQAGAGSGGGGSSPKEKDLTEFDESQLKNLEDELDRYHDINNALEITSQLLNKISTEKDRAFGGNKVTKINEEIKALDREIKNYQKLLEEATKYMKQDSESLKNLGYSISTDEKGQITNYEAMQAAAMEKYNAAYTQYIAQLNAAETQYNSEIYSIGEDAAEATYNAAKKQIEAIWKAAQEDYSKFETYSSKYEEDVKKALEAEKNIQSSINEQYDDELEKITTIADLWEDIFELRSSYFDFLEKSIGDELEDAIDRVIVNFDRARNASDSYDQSISNLEETLEHMGIDYDDFMSLDDYEIPDIVTQNDIEKLEQYRDAIQKAAETLIDLRDNILNELQKQFDGLNEKIEGNIKRIDVLKDWVSTYQNIIDIVGKRILDPSGELSRKLANTTYLQARENTKQLRSQLDYQEAAIKQYEEMLLQLQKTNADGANDAMIQNIKEQLNQATQEYESTQSEWLSSWEKTVQGATDIFSVEIENISDKLGKAISGMAGSLSVLQDQFDKANDINEEYVDDYEKIYQLSKLNRDISNSINDTDNIASKEALKELQEEINALQEDETKMSEYDLENLRRKYELRLAYEQLQEAQNAKSEVRMTRDTEGNWGYVYTADSDAVSEAESNYEDKLYAMQQANTEYIKTLQENIVNIQSEYQEALAGIVPGDYESEAEYQAAVKQMQDYYLEKIRYFYDEMNKVTNNNQELYDQDWKAYSEKTGYKISADEDFIDKFNETVISQITGYETTEEAQNAFIKATEEATTAMNQAWNDWYKNTQQGLELGGKDIENYSDQVKDDIDNIIVPATEELTDATNKMAEEASEDFSKLADNVENFASQYNSTLQQMTEFTNELTHALDELLSRFTEMEDSDYDSDSSGDTSNWTWQQDSTGWWYGDGKGNYYQNGWQQIGGKWYYFGEDGYMATDSVNDRGYTWELNKNHDGTYGSWTNSNPLDSSGNVATDYVIGNYTKAKEYWSKMLQNMFSSFDTGGYTGSWNSSEGKLAMLHSKELVLNSSDTANILSAVDLIRSISSGIDLNALCAAGGILGNLTAGSVSSNEETLEQQVHITAEFPNVSDKNEILEAFDNVINLAAQYAQRS